MRSCAEESFPASSRCSVLATFWLFSAVVSALRAAFRAFSALATLRFSIVIGYVLDDLVADRTGLTHDQCGPDTDRTRGQLRRREPSIRFIDLAPSCLGLASRPHQQPRPRRPARVRAPAALADCFRWSSIRLDQAGATGLIGPLGHHLFGIRPSSAGPSSSRRRLTPAPSTPRSVSHRATRPHPASSASPTPRPAQPNSRPTSCRATTAWFRAPSEACSSSIRVLA